MSNQLPVRRRPLGNAWLVKAGNVRQAVLRKGLAAVAALWIAGSGVLGFWYDAYATPAGPFPGEVRQCSSTGEIMKPRILSDGYLDYDDYSISMRCAGGSYHTLEPGEVGEPINAPDYLTRVGHNLEAYAAWLGAPFALLAFLLVCRRALLALAAFRTQKADDEYGVRMDEMTEQARKRLYVISSLIPGNKGMVTLSGFALADPTDRFEGLMLNRSNIRWGWCASAVSGGWFTGASYGPDGLLRGAELLLSSPENVHGFAEAALDVGGIPRDYGHAFRNM